MRKDEFIAQAVSEYIKLNDVQKAYVLGFMNSAVMYSKQDDETDSKPPDKKPEKVSRQIFTWRGCVLSCGRYWENKGDVEPIEKIKNRHIAKVHNIWIRR